MKLRFAQIRKWIPSGGGTFKAFGITMLAMLAISGPAFATSAVLIPYLTIIQQVITDQLTKTVSEGFTKTAQNLIKSQVEQYTKELTAKMMPGAFCESDIAQAAIGGVVARATGYDEAKGIFAATGADTVISPERAMGQLPSYNPNVVIQQHNKEVRSYAQRAARQNNNCSPVQASPVDATGSSLQCTQEERRIAAAVLVGVSPPAELPDAANAGALGEVYESSRTTQIARKQLAALALSDASSWQKEQFIKGYRELLKKPSIEELNANSASGGVQRDSVVLQQLTAQLLLEEYVEKLEQKRLIATMVAQQADAEDREYLSKLRRR